MENEVYRRERDFTVCGTVGICATTREQLVKEILELPRTPVSANVALIGVPAVVMAKDDPKIEEIYSEATIAAIDGMPIAKIGRRKGFACERCGATDFMDILLRESVERNMTHYFYGGKNNEVLDKLRENLIERFPGIQIKGMYSPPFRPLTEEEDRAICEKINSLKPDFLWVGIGAPKQEVWMQEHREKIHGTVMLGVGAAFDFFAGTLKKAPEWMENAGLEWLFRLVMEPKRLWKRYIIGGAKFVLYSCKARYVRKKPILCEEEYENTF